MTTFLRYLTPAILFPILLLTGLLACFAWYWTALRRRAPLYGTLQPGSAAETRPRFTFAGHCHPLVRLDALLMLGLTGFIFVGEPFIEAWGGGEYEGAYPIALMLMAPVTIPLIQNLGIEIQRAKNMHQFRSIVYIFMALGNVLISIPLGMKWDGLGCAMGTAISLLLGNGLVMNWYYHTHIGLDIGYFWRRIGQIVPALIPPVLLGAIAVNLHAFAGYGGVLLFAVPYTAVYAACIYLFAMDAGERQLVQGMFRKIARR